MWEESQKKSWNSDNWQISLGDVFSYWAMNAHLLSNECPLKWALIARLERLFFSLRAIRKFLEFLVNDTFIQNHDT